MVSLQTQSLLTQKKKLAYEGALAYARELNADLVVLTDPDADRLGVVVKHRGSYHFLNGNQTASLTLEYILNRRKANDLLPKKRFCLLNECFNPFNDSYCKCIWCDNGNDTDWV